MAFTQADLDALEAAIAHGDRSVTLADGRRTDYRDISELLKARDLVKAELAAATSSASRLIPRHRRATFGD